MAMCRSSSGRRGSVDYRLSQVETVMAPGTSLQLANTSLIFSQRTSKSAISAISAIPVEILLMIIDHLSKPWALSLALTCKNFLSVVKSYYGKRLALRNQYLWIFLSTLQRDVPGVYFCFGCQKLRHFDTGRRWKDQNHQECFTKFCWEEWNFTRRELSKQQIELLWHPCMREATVHFMEAYLVMNRHFFGELHGLPLQTLERHFTFEKFIDLKSGHITEGSASYNCLRRFPRFDFPGTCEQTIFDQRPEGSRAEAFKRPWRFSFDYVPKIIDDELYMARFHKIDGPMVSWKHFVELLNGIHLPICHHLQCLAKVESYCHLFIQYNYGSIPPEDLTLDQSHRQQSSCPNCYTDYDIWLNRDEDKKEWSLRLCTYHYLGSCRSPHDIIWKYLACQTFQDWDSRYVRARCRYRDRGKARRTWHESNRIALRLKEARAPK